MILKPQILRTALFMETGEREVAEQGALGQPTDWAPGQQPGPFCCLHHSPPHGEPWLVNQCPAGGRVTDPNLPPLPTLLQECACTCFPLLNMFVGF